MRGTRINQVVIALGLPALAANGAAVSAQADSLEELLYVRSHLRDDTADTWSFDGPAGHTLEVTASSPDFDTVIELRSPTGEELARNDDHDGTDSRLVATLLTDGVHYIDVSSWEDGGGAYELSVLAAPKPLESDVPPELLFYAKANLDDQADQWSFEGQGGQTVAVTASSLAFDTVAELRSPAGETLAFNDDHGDGTDSRVTTTLPIDGLYGIEVRSWMEAGGGSYQVVVQVVQQEEAPVPTGDSLEEGGAEPDPEAAARAIDNLDLLRYVPQRAAGSRGAGVRRHPGSGGRRRPAPMAGGQPRGVRRLARPGGRGGRRPRGARSRADRGR